MRFSFLAFLVVLLTSFAPSVNNQPFVVVIDVGHGGMDVGAEIDGNMEKDITMAVAQKIKARQQDTDYLIYFTRNDDQQMGLRERVDFAISKNADLFISLHVGNGPTEQSGARVFYPESGDYKTSSQDLAENLTSILAHNEFGLGSLPTSSANFFLLKNTRCPSLTVEMGNLNNATDRELLTQEFVQDWMADAILKFIDTNR